MTDLLLTLLGLILLVGGAEALVRGGVGVARALGIPPVIVGLTIIAFGTSTPELVVNLLAARRGTSEMAFGNVVGSNIANIGLLLGITVLYRPLLIHHSIVVREIPMLLLASAAAVVLGVDRWFGGATDAFARSDGLMLLLLFAVFLYYLVGDALRLQPTPEAPEPAAAASPGRGWLSIAVVLIVGGLAGLVGGGELTVRGAVGLARAAGVGEVVIGLTIVAVGTSLPELATSLVAARRGEHDVAVGNIVGSGIFNLLFIHGLTMTLRPASLPAGGAVDLLVMTGLATLLLVLTITHHRLVRLEGLLLLAVYAGYLGWLVVR